MINEAYYCGAWEDRPCLATLHDTLGTSLHPAKIEDFPLPYSVVHEGKLLRSDAKEGHIHCWYSNKWIIVTFRDRSVNDLPESHSTFLIPNTGNHTLPLRALIKRLHELFPHVFNRLKTPLYLPDGSKLW